MAHQARSGIGPPGRTASQPSTSAFIRGCPANAQQVRDERVGVGRGQARPREAAVVEARGAEARLHRLVERRVVLGAHGMERDAQERGLDDGAGGEGRVEVGGIEADHPVPEGEVRRRRLLRLQGDDPADGLDSVERLPAQQELPARAWPG